MAKAKTATTTAAVEKQNAPAPVVQAAEAPAKGKSIIDPEYRAKYKEPDWLGQQIIDHGSALKEITEGEGAQAVKRNVPNGVDVEKVFGIATANGIDVTKYRAQVGSHGFEGRLRMTIRNMIQSVIKQRHGAWFGGKFVEAPAEFLAKISAPVAPTHTPTGEKITKAGSTAATATATSSAPAAAASPSKGKKK